MPVATRDGLDLYYEQDGSGETVAFVADAGFGAWSWGWQHRAVAGPFAALVWDHRGTGRSDPAEEYAVAAMAADLEAVLADAGVRAAHLVGLGLGGMVALRYAREYDRARTLALVGTTAGPDAAVDPAVREDLLAGGDAALAAVLSDRFRADHPDVVERIRAWRAAEDAPREVHDAQLAAAERFDATGWLYEVTDSALVVHGGADRVWPADAGRALADGLPRGEFRRFDGAGHLVTAERSRPVNDALLGFLDEHSASDRG